MKIKVLFLLLPAIALLAYADTASAQYFTPGDLVVSVYGSLTSDTITDGMITPITLEEYSLPNATSASLVLTDQLPTSGIDGNVGIDGEDGSSSEGTLQLSGNGEDLVIGGYDATAAANGIQAATNSANKTSFADGTQWSTSTIALAQSADTDVPRVIATIDPDGDVNTSTVLNDIYNTNNARAAYSPDGTSFYISGQGASASDEGGIYSTTLGTNTTLGGAAPTPIFNVVSTRDVLEYGGNLYYSADQNSSKKGTQTGIFEYSGLPTSSQGSNTGTRLTPASGTIYAGGGFTPMGTGTSVNFSPEDFAFANSTTMYVADTGDPKAGGTGDGGIQKWTLSSGTWTLDYTLAPSTFLAPSEATTAADGETGFEDLAIDVVGSNVDIYAVSYTAGDADPNGLYGVVDSLSNLSASVAEDETVTEIEAAPGTSDAGGLDYNFKGVSFAPTTAAVPEPETWAMAAGGLGALLGFKRMRKRA
jgi:hypothetical protein